MRAAGENFVIVDGRPFAEYRKMNIPGGICCPNGELALRIRDLVPDPKTKIVQFPYYLPDWNNITKADSEPDFQKVLLGKLTAKEFADELAGKLNDAQAGFAQHQKK